MNFAGNSGSTENTNVLALFGNAMTSTPDPLQTLLDEAQIEAFAQEDEEESVEVETKASRLVVNENQFPDSSMFVLEEQLATLKQNMARLRFYLSDLDDLLPR